VVNLTNYSVDFYGACEPITSAIPWNAWPEKTHGVQKLSASLTNESAENAVEIAFEGLGVNASGTASIMAALFIDDELYARKVWMPNPFAANYLTPIGGSFIYEPNDTITHTYKIRLGSAAGTVWFNGTSAGTPMVGGASVCTLTVKELK
jgi:hypothetical protein